MNFLGFSNLLRLFHSLKKFLEMAYSPFLMDVSKHWFDSGKPDESFKYPLFHLIIKARKNLGFSLVCKNARDGAREVELFKNIFSLILLHE